MGLSTQYKSLKNKVVFITGGASVIGKSFYRTRSKVAFIDLNQNMAAELLASLSLIYFNNIWFKAIDVTQSEAL